LLKQTRCILNDVISGGHNVIFAQAIRPERSLHLCILGCAQQTLSPPPGQRTRHFDNG
jgi:hypothetical protein